MTSHGADGRPPVVIYSDTHWRCYACNERGDAIAMMAVSMGYDRHPRGRAFIRVADAMREVGCDLPVRIAEEEREESYGPRVPADELRSAWEQSFVVDMTWAMCRDALREFCERRGYTGDRPFGDEARWLPDSRWPGWLKRGYPLIIPMYSGTGEFMGLHGRAVDGRTPKTTNPYGYDARGLLFLSRRIRDWLRGDDGPPKQILLVEGATDFLTSATKRPTIGGVSGSWAALKLLPLGQDTEVFTAMDPDAAGRNYEMNIADALWPIVAQPLPLRRISKAQ